MLHEIRNILHRAYQDQNKGLQSVMASVVKLEGSSYRRPGVRMGISSDGEMTGAVSGGCVEKEILRQSKLVFGNHVPHLMTYDGRYRLGCEGILHILIEPLSVNEELLEAFENQWKSRRSFSINSHFPEQDQGQGGGSVFRFNEGDYKLPNQGNLDEKMEMFEQILDPGFRLIIVGAEHDAVELCRAGSGLGWEVRIIAPPDEPKSIEYFPGAAGFHAISETEFTGLSFDRQTAVVFMTHSYVKDLKYLSALLDKEVAYMGMLGPSDRRDKIFNQFMEYHPDTDLEFFEKLHGPAGINIGAETPQEIAISVIAEILSKTRNQYPIPLKDKSGRIHQL